MLVLLSLFFLMYPALLPKLSAFEWPFGELQIARTFAGSQNENFLKGVEIENSGEGVKPIEEGSLIFIAGESPRHQGGLPSGLGNSMVLEHERGIRSVYGFLDEIPDRPGTWTLQRDELLSFVGNSGGTSGDVLYLQVIDSEFEQVVNPFVSLPTPEDASAPVIGGVFLANGEMGNSGENTSELGRRNSIEAGNYDILIESYDLSKRVEFFRPMAPYSFRIYINGEEKISLRFEAITADDFSHNVVDSYGLSHDMIYENTWLYRLGELRLNPGDAMVEVVVSDYAGNEASKTFQVTVP